jgi:Outer membrane protein beta-barrel domain
MLPVSPGKITVSLLLALAALISPLSAQYQKYHESDLRKFNLGFTMGMGIYGYDMTVQRPQTDPFSGIVLKNVEPVRQPGIYLGLITNLRIVDHIDFRFQPSVSLEQRNFKHTFIGSTADSVVFKKTENANLNLPLALKFKSDFYRSYRVYALGGVQFSANLASNKKVVNDPDAIKIQNTDFGIVAAFGIDLYGEKLKLTPEIRYVLGLPNVHISENSRFPYAISDLRSQAFIITLNFE